MNLQYDNLTFCFENKENKEKIFIKNELKQLGYMQYKADNESSVYITYEIKEANIEQYPVK